MGPFVLSMYCLLCAVDGRIIKSSKLLDSGQSVVDGSKQLLPLLGLAGNAFTPTNLATLAAVGVLVGLPLMGLVAAGPFLLGRIFRRDSDSVKRQSKPGFKVTNYEVDMSLGGYEPSESYYGLGVYGPEGYGLDGYGPEGYGLEGYGPSGYESDSRIEESQFQSQSERPHNSSSNSITKRRSFNPYGINWETFSILDWIAIAEETWKKFEPGNLDCQKRMICEIHQNAPKFGYIAKKMVDIFSYLEYAEVLRLPEEVKSLIEDYLDAADRGRSMKKDCGDVYGGCNFSVKKIVDRVSHNEI